MAGSLWVPPVIRLASYLVWIFGTLWYFLLYPKQLRKRIINLGKQKTTGSMVIESDFFLAEGYVIDMSKGYLFGLFLLNPFKFQYMDLQYLEDVEIIKIVFNKSVVASVRCRLHMNGEKYDIWLHRDSRYGKTLAVGEDMEVELNKYTENVKVSLLEAAKAAKMR